MTPTVTILINDYFPSGWSLRNLINLDPGWQVNAADDEHIVVATGDTIEAALDAAEAKIARSEFVGRFAWLAHAYRDEAPKAEGGSLLSRLGLTRKATPFTDRRL